MKWLRTLVLFEKGNILSTDDWKAVHSAYVRSIESIDYPRGSGKLTIRKKSRAPNGQWRRNGVGYLRKRFLDHLVGTEDWLPETAVGKSKHPKTADILLYPSLEKHREPITSEFGEFDFETKSPSGLRIAIEWETGNISSSHRSMNKLAISLGDGTIHVGVLIVPSRALYEHMTDRIGNIGELSGYLRLWQGMRGTVKRGLLAISVVEHDHVSDNSALRYFTAGTDGMSRKPRKSRTRKKH